MEYNFERIKVLITSACNSNCTHCFRRTDKNTKEISWEKIKEIVDFGVKNNCKQFSFSGGEFFTHPAAYKLIEYCLSKNVNVSILTNALEIDMSLFERMEKKEKISFQVSIDGLKEKHDLRRGKGSFEKTMTNVKKLYDLGFALSAKTVLDENNYIDIVDILQMPWFRNVLVLPVAFTKNERGQVDSAEYKKFEEAIKLIYTTLSTKNDYKCRCYPQELAIKYDGNVYPCTEAREHDEYVMCNITDKSIEYALSEYESHNEKFICPQEKVPACMQCENSSVCNHGCRLRALRFYGHLLAPDPFNCYIFNGAHTDVPMGQLFWGGK